MRSSARLDANSFARMVRLDRLRIAAALKRPTLSLFLGVALPTVLLSSALLTLGRIGVFATSGAGAGSTLGLLISGTISFLSYGVLFGSSDALFLRRIGIEPSALYLERSLRLAVVALVVVAAVMLPYLAAEESLMRPLYIAVASASVTAGGAALVYAAAAVATVAGRSGLLSAGIRKWDPGLARAAPLVYAPLVPFLAGGGAGALIAAQPGHEAVLTAIALSLGLAGGVGSAQVFRPVAGRFLPRTGEMAYSPPPPEGEGEAFHIGRGLSGLLPRKAGAVWVRDAAVGGRRFSWAARVTWPVAIVSIIALARWGESSATRVWVISAVGIALILQAAAVVSLGMLERRGPGWIDRAVGIGWWERYLGRYAWSWGLSLWLLIPVALAWRWWSGAPGAWLWPSAGTITAAIASGASILIARRGA